VCACAGAQQPQLLTSTGGTCLARTIDVGVSYGAFCIAGVLAYRLPMPWRVLYAAALLAIFASRTTLNMRTALTGAPIREKEHAAPSRKP